MSFNHPRRIAVLLPHARDYAREGMTESEAAYAAGKTARMNGRPERENPHTGDLAAQWISGYRDNRR